MEENVSLSKLTTFKIGGPARFLFRVKSVEDLRLALKFAEDRKMPFFILGGGSNILADDDGFNGVVIKNELLGIEFQDLGDVVKVTSGAGEPWDAFVSRVVSAGLYGLENLSGVPGTVGATPVQNIGAYGVEAGDLISSVETLDAKTGELKFFTKEECLFGYRNSFFKTPGGKKYVITRVSFILKKNGFPNIEYKDLKNYFSMIKSTPSLLDVRNAILEIRRSKFPDLSVIGTAGSFFKNPFISKAQWEKLKKKFPDLPGFEFSDGTVKVSLAWILDKILQLKGFVNGSVGLYQAQPLVVINSGDGKAADILILARDIEKKVESGTGIRLEWEVEYLN